MSYFSEHSVLMLWVGKLKVFVLIAMLVHVSSMAFYAFGTRMCQNGIKQ